jgi:hypothetical protein
LVHVDPRDVTGNLRAALVGVGEVVALRPHWDSLELPEQIGYEAEWFSDFWAIRDRLAAAAPYEGANADAYAEIVDTMTLHRGWLEDLFRPDSELARRSA